MSRAQPKSSPMDRYARSIAAAIAKGRPPALTPDLDLYLESSPREIFVAFEDVARHMPPSKCALGRNYLKLARALVPHQVLVTDSRVGERSARDLQEVTALNYNRRPRRPKNERKLSLLATDDEMTPAEDEVLAISIPGERGEGDPALPGAHALWVVRAGRSVRKKLGHLKMQRVSLRPR
jgi:hypothetical protein